MEIKRPTLNNYENQGVTPPIELLIRFSDYFGISIDTLIKIDLSALSQFQLRELEQGNDVYVTGTRLRVLASTVGNDNEENIELVPEKAKAGYLSGFADPEYIVSLPVFRLPFLDNSKKYRTFQIAGDSMHPIPDGSWVTGVFLCDWTLLKNNDACIIVTSDDGILFKLVENQIKSKGAIRCISLNPFYKPYELEVGKIKEIWKFVHYISAEIPETAEMDYLAKSVLELKNDVAEIKKMIPQ
jgi:phage repressor protein C with HTH and peptisase S24 domain